MEPARARMDMREAEVEAGGATALRAELIELFRRGVGEPLPDSDFDALARRVFEHQFTSVSLYRHFAEARGITPATLDHWTGIPAVPTSAFKRFAFHPDDRGAERIFRTSGTRSRGRRGEHHVVDLSLYDEAALPNFRAHLLTAGVRPSMVALVTDPAETPDSSLSYMLGLVRDRLCGGGGGFFFDAQRGLDIPRLEAALVSLEESGEPVLVAGTAFAFAIWWERSPQFQIRLPPGSSLMETGGFKGRMRQVPREALYGELSRRLGLQEKRIVGEYGMTELLSQFYEPVLREPGGRRRFLPPPWVRTRVLDPVSLEAMPEGEPGILAHFDLANLFSVSSVVTEDLGVWREDGFTVLGRSAGAEPRGCSLTVEELERAASGG